MDYHQVLEDLAAALQIALTACDPPQVLPNGAVAGVNLPELLSQALAMVAMKEGGIEALVRHRPGCWEANDVRHLAMGAVASRALGELHLPPIDLG